MQWPRGSPRGLLVDGSRWDFAFGKGASCGCPGSVLSVPLGSLAPLLIQLPPAGVAPSVAPAGDVARAQALSDGPLGKAAGAESCRALSRQVFCDTGCLEPMEGGAGADTRPADSPCHKVPAIRWQQCQEWREWLLALCVTGACLPSVLSGACVVGPCGWGHVPRPGSWRGGVRSRLWVSPWGPVSVHAHTSGRVPSGTPRCGPSWALASPGACGGRSLARGLGSALWRPLPPGSRAARFAPLPGALSPPRDGVGGGRCLYGSVAARSRL